MIDTRVLSDERPLNGIRRLFHFDDETEQVTIETQQTMDDVLAANQRVRNAHDERSNWKGDLHLVASIPLTLYYDLKRKGIIGDQAKLKRWLNTAENRIFRTRPGAV